MRTRNPQEQNVKDREQERQKQHRDGERQRQIRETEREGDGERQRDAPSKNSCWSLAGGTDPLLFHNNKGITKGKVPGLSVGATL